MGVGVEEWERRRDRESERGRGWGMLRWDGNEAGWRNGLDGNANANGEEGQRSKGVVVV